MQNRTAGSGVLMSRRLCNAPYCLILALVHVITILPIRAFAHTRNQSDSHGDVSTEVTVLRGNAEQADAGSSLHGVPGTSGDLSADQVPQDSIAEVTVATAYARSSGRPAGALKTAPIPNSSPQREAMSRYSAGFSGGSSVVSSAAGQASIGSRTISLPSGPATTEGAGEQFQPDLASGAATLALPLALLPARGAAGPSLSLAYSSAAGNSVVGVGWSIGVPFVARETAYGVPGYDDRAEYHAAQDRFIYNGSELVPLGVVRDGAAPAAAPDEQFPPWAEGWQYFRVRIEGGFFRFFWAPDHRTWRIQAAQGGVTYELGVPLDGSEYEGALELATQGDSTRIYRWNIARAYDAYGEGKPLEDAEPKPYNTVVYRYLHDSGVAYLSDIYDTPPAADPAGASLAQYAHHTRLRWQERPDATSSYRRGWAVQQRLRLAGVDVSAKPAGEGIDAVRRQVRRYHLAYDPAWHISLLATVQEEGRCAGSELDPRVPIEDEQGELPVTTDCGLRPPTEFAYSHVDAPDPITTVAGYEQFDGTIRHLQDSPGDSLESSYGMALMDINADALPDAVDGDTYANYGAQRVFINTMTTSAGGFSSPVSATFEQTQAPGGWWTDGYDFSLRSNDVAPLDYDGDGLLNLALLPFYGPIFVYSPEADGQQFVWRGHAPESISPGDTDLQLARANQETRLFDANNDGLVDIVTTTASGTATYFSLSRYEGGESKFGHAFVTSTGEIELSSEPVYSCAPAQDGLLTFADGRVRIADMNGDGLLDIVRIKAASIEYWPGRGRGRWGIGDPDQCSSNSIALPVLMDQNPVLMGFSDEALRVADVSGDGLADVVAIDGYSIYIWLSINGTSWSPQVEVPRDRLSMWTRTVHLADINGSGSLDILFGDEDAYRYIDLLDGKRPWLLTRVDSGSGKSTLIEYSTSVEEMAAAATDGRPWLSTVPFSFPVVKRVTTTAKSTELSGNGPDPVTEYDYRDPVFDRHAHAFRVFRTVTARNILGTNGEATSIRRHFHSGECIKEADPESCSRAASTNARAGLRGRVRAIEVFDDSGVFLSTKHSTYRIRHMYTGLDGRTVRMVFGEAIDEYRYETEPFTSAEETIETVDAHREDNDGQLTSELGELTLRSAAGRVHLRSELSVDRLGRITERRALGCISGCDTADETITTHYESDRVPGDHSGWFFVATGTYVSGSREQTRRLEQRTVYDSYGRPKDIIAVLSGSLPLQRFHEDGALTAPPPSDASSDGEIVVKAVSHDRFGNVVGEVGAGHRCHTQIFDEEYAALPVQEITHAGPEGADGCGSRALPTTAGHDRGARAVVSMVGPSGAVSEVELDEHGRLLRIFQADPNALGETVASASAEFQYFVPNDERPVSVVHSLALVGQEDSEEPWYVGSWTITDGLGRKVAQFSPADPELGDAGDWIVEGCAQYDARGLPLRAYEPFFWSGDPRAFSVTECDGRQFERLVYDSFGRSTERYATDGSLVARVERHPMTEDAWDAADLAEGKHHGTFVTARRDGHGRTVGQVERIHIDGELAEIETETEYLPTGEPQRITRRIRGSAEPQEVVRWLRYDSLGRLVLNVEPNTSVGMGEGTMGDLTSVLAWRYAHNDAGDLVGTSDARGCGVNLHYDTAGRLVAKDFSPCLSSQQPYSTPDLQTGDGTEELYRYDEIDVELSLADTGCVVPLASYVGHLVSVSTRGARDLTIRDARGRGVCLARQVAKPGPTASVLAERYAPRWYHRTIQYDRADRVVRATMGVRSAELTGTGSSSALQVHYSRRGVVTSVDGSYGTLVQQRTFDALGRPDQVQYGDAAETTTTYGYDVRHRLSRVVTVRGHADVWDSLGGECWPAPSSTEPTQQTVLEDSEIVYDDADNPVELHDYRDPRAWPDGAKPVTRYMDYDDFYRVTNVEYIGTDGVWNSPFAAELAEQQSGYGPERAIVPPVSFERRIQQETFEYDWLGNIVWSDDDAHGFYDRSLGEQSMGTASRGPHQLLASSNDAVNGERSGSLSAQYDASGNLVELVVRRGGECLDEGSSCWQRFVYQWDEEGFLVQARRWDLRESERGTAASVTGELPARNADVVLLYKYGAGGDRVIKTAEDDAGEQVHDVYVFDTLELRRTVFDKARSDYDATYGTERLRLAIGGLSLGRVVYAEQDVPAAACGRQRVVLELSDHLGSTTKLIDKDTGELIEHMTYSAYGTTETDYRPERWGAFREDYRFGGKEEDVEVGLLYFGKRYYSPALHRWMSPDPIAVHELGSDPNVYAYVSGRTFAAVDPDGQAAWLIVLAAGAFSATVSYAMQRYQDPDNISWSKVAIAGVAGAAGGALGVWAGLWAGAAGMGGLGASIVGGMAGGVGGGITHRGLELMPALNSGRMSSVEYLGAVLDPGTVLRDGIIGGAAGMVCYGISKGVNQLWGGRTPAPSTTGRPGVGELTTGRVGDVGEEMATAVARRQLGVKGAMPVQNKSGHGVDLIGHKGSLSNPKEATIVALEVKSASGGKPWPLSKPQQDPGSFVRTRLTKAVDDPNVSAIQQQHARAMLDALDNGATLKTYVIDVRYVGTSHSFSTVRPWTLGGEKQGVFLPSPSPPQAPMRAPIILPCYTTHTGEVFCDTGVRRF